MSLTTDHRFDTFVRDHSEEGGYSFAVALGSAARLGGSETHTLVLALERVGPRCIFISFTASCVHHVLQPLLEDLPLLGG